MGRYVLDAPTVLDRNLRDDPNHQLVAPNIIRSEALQLLLDDVRHGKRTGKAALETQERLTGLKLRLLEDRGSCRSAWRIAVRNDRETRGDAEYW